MHNEFEKNYTKVENYVNKQGFNYIGICAGAFIAGETSTMHSLNYIQRYDEDLRRKAYDFFNDISIDFNTMNLLPSISTYGPFFPYRNADPSYRYPGEFHRPFEVNIEINENHTSTTLYLPQLYAEGCTFTTTRGDAPLPTNQVMAHYKTYPTMSYCPGMPGRKQPTIIFREPNGNAGGVLLSGTHFETCVDSSQLLASFISPTSVPTCEIIEKREGWSYLTEKETLVLTNKETKSAQKEFVESPLKRCVLHI